MARELPAADHGSVKIRHSLQVEKTSLERRALSEQSYIEVAIASQKNILWAVFFYGFVHNLRQQL
jgi:hypothetical protein